jgi:hypothetical protein
VLAPVRRAHPGSFAGYSELFLTTDAYADLRDVATLAPFPVGPDGTPVTADLLVPDGVVRTATTRPCSKRVSSRQNDYRDRVSVDLTGPQDDSARGERRPPD